jgi:hypothetical protein
MGWHYHQQDQRRREPVIFANALCIADKVYSPITNKEMSYGKSSFVYFMLFIDFLVIIISIWFIFFLFYRYKEYAKVFDDKNVEMRDFTLKFGNIPYDYIYGGKDIMLHCQLWSHIETCLRLSFESKARYN